MKIMKAAKETENLVFMNVSKIKSCYLKGLQEDSELFQWRILFLKKENYKQKLFKVDTKDH